MAQSGPEYAGIPKVTSLKGRPMLWAIVVDVDVSARESRWFWATILSKTFQLALWRKRTRALS